MDKRFFAATLSVLLILSALFVLPAYALEKTGLATPEGYDDNDYQKMAAFLETKNENGVKNGDLLYENYDPSDPESWIWEDEEAGEDCVFWEQSDTGKKRINFVYFCSDVCGDLDLSGFSELTDLFVLSDKVTSLNIDGCEKLSVFICDPFVESIHWTNREKDVWIMLDSEGEGAVAISAEYGEWDTMETTVSYWYADAKAKDGYEFLGWYDANGKLVSEENRYEFFSGAIGVMEVSCPAPFGTHVELTARFTSNEPETTDTPAPTETAEEPTEAPETTEGSADPTEAPADPTETPADQTAEPDTEGTGSNAGRVWKTILICLAAVAGAAAIAGIVIAVFRRKKKA